MKFRQSLEFDKTLLMLNDKFAEGVVLGVAMKRAISLLESGEQAAQNIEDPFLRNASLITTINLVKNVLEAVLSVSQDLQASVSKPPA